MNPINTDHVDPWQLHDVGLPEDVVEMHDQKVEWMAVDRVDEGLGAVVTGDTEEADELGGGVAADDDGGDGVREGELHGVAHGQNAGAGGDGGAFPSLLLGFERGWGPSGEQAAARRDLHADDAHLSFDG